MYFSLCERDRIFSKRQKNKVYRWDLAVCSILRVSVTDQHSWRVDVLSPFWEGHWPLTGCNFEFLNHRANSTFFCCIALKEWDHIVFPRRSSPWAPSQPVKSKWHEIYLVQSGFMIFFVFFSEIIKTDEILTQKVTLSRSIYMLQWLYQRDTSEGLKEVGFQ